MLRSPVNIPVTKQRQCILICPKAPNHVILTIGVGGNGEWKIKRQATSPYVHWLVHFNKPHGRDQPMTLVAMSKSLIITGGRQMSHAMSDSTRFPEAPLFVVLHQNQKVQRVGTLTIHFSQAATRPMVAKRQDSVPCHTYCRLALLHSSARVMQENILLDTCTLALLRDSPVTTSRLHHQRPTVGTSQTRIRYT